ncbi:MAG: hypothetical protein ACR2QO_25750, partial [Acidimicrobiales bacterium]
MLVEDPGPPTGELGHYYWSYGANADGGSPASVLAAPEDGAPAPHRDAYTYAPDTYATNTYAPDTYTPESWFDETNGADANDDYGSATLSQHALGHDTLGMDVYDPDADEAAVYEPVVYEPVVYESAVYERDGAYPEEHDGYYDDWSWTDRPYPTYLTDRFRVLINRAELLPTRWMARYASLTIQFGLGLVFAWFGALKFVPGLSPAEGLVRATAAELLAPISFTGLQPTLFLLLLAAWEVLIGIGFLLDIRRRVVVWMVLLHMVGTALPLVLLPEVVWTRFPYALSLEGQYII